MSQEHFALMEKLISETLLSYNYTHDLITEGWQAWVVYHKSGCFDAFGRYMSPYNDAHIQMALEKIFPNIVFKDKKRY
jgi:hypothetical protein